MSAPDEGIPPRVQPSSRAGRRLHVLDAFIDAILEGDVPPTPSDVAERAGVSRATFFRYFATLDEFRVAAAARVQERFPELFTLPALGTGSLDQRIDSFVDARLRLNEALHPLALPLLARAAHDTDAARLVDGMRQRLAEQVRQHFASDLRQHSPARRDDIVTAIAVLTSVEAWQQVRRSHHLTPGQTSQAWRTALAALLTGSTGATDDSEVVEHGVDIQPL